MNWFEYLLLGGVALIAVGALCHSIGVRVEQQKQADADPETVKAFEERLEAAEQKAEAAKKHSREALHGVADIARVQLAELLTRAKPHLPTAREASVPERARSTFEPVDADSATTTDEGVQL